MLSFIEKIKFTFIEYIHLIIIVFILFSLFINNMPVNFQFDKLIANYIPETFTPQTAKNTFGIEDPLNSKLYDTIAYLYGLIRSFLSPNYKTMIFKIIMLVFIIAIAFDMDYTNMFLISTFSILIVSTVFWLILSAGTSDNDMFPESYKNIIKDLFNDIQADLSIPVFLNVLISVLIMIWIWFLLKKTKQSTGSFLSEPPITTIFVLSAILILYLRIDGIVSFVWEGIIKGRVIPFGKEWLKNMITERHHENIIIRWIAFSLYLAILGVTLLLSTNRFRGSSFKKYSLFNNLIDQTNHPISILVFYTWYFLLRTDYGYGWLGWFVFLSIVEIIYISNSGWIKTVSSGLEQVKALKSEVIKIRNSKSNK
tara:strand:- start:701 stop:1804 length:1104 start_codon:yes stop_codon:yes gene_type:complete